MFSDYYDPALDFAFYAVVATLVWGLVGFFSLLVLRDRCPPGYRLTGDFAWRLFLLIVGSLAGIVVLYVLGIGVMMAGNWLGIFDGDTGFGITMIEVAAVAYPIVVGLRLAFAIHDARKQIVQMRQRIARRQHSA